jgi:hypothetical protein
LINFEEAKPVIKQVACDNFWAFCCYYDWDFYKVNRRFFKPVAQLFQTVIDEYKQGNAISVSVSMPPRSGKSYITSLFAAFWLSQFPEQSVMRNSCTSSLYQKFSYDTRNIIRSQKFRELFPAIELQGDKQNLDGWNLTTSKQVGYFGAGVGGTIIGFGANLAITDDLYKSMQDALSSNTNAFVKLWKESAHDSRKEKNCPEIFIGTRWTKDDIIGEAMEKGYLAESISIAALVNDKSFCEDVKTTAEYLQIKERISPSTWNAEYMQEPLSLEGLLLPIESLHFGKPSTETHFCVAVGDPADTGGDKYSMPFIDVLEHEGQLACYVRDVIHSTAGIEANTSRIIDKSNYNNTEQIFIESNGVGLAAVIHLKNNLGVHRKLSAFPSTLNKEVRIQSHYEFVQKYFIFDQEKMQSDQEYREFVRDLTSYTKIGDNKHKKDAIDVCCSAAAIIKIKYKKVLYG